MQKYLTRIGEAIWGKIQIVNRAVLGAVALGIALLVVGLALVIIL
jgi:hypothetical protein